MAATPRASLSGAEVDPISRIEGHLGVAVDTNASGYIDGANVHGNLWRGFENFLIGRNPNDAITFTQRICGVCPLPHATASMFNVEKAFGYSKGYITFATDAEDPGYGVPGDAVLIRNLVYATEFVMSHITHFYHLVAPSYIQGPNMAPWTPYFADDLYHPLLVNSGADAVPTLGGTGDGNPTYPNTLWGAVIKSYVKALRMRRLTFEAGSFFAGRMPMTSSFVAGGVTLESGASVASKKTLFRTIYEEIGNWHVKEYVPIALALGALYPNFDNLDNATTLNAATLNSGALWTLGDQTESGVAPAALTTGWGAGCGNFLAWGAFPDGDATGTLACAGGWVKDAGGTPSSGALATNAATADAAADEVEDRLVEFIGKSRYANYGSEFGDPGNGGLAAYPGDVTRTEPDRTDAAKYSWIKAPRWNCAATVGVDPDDFQPMEVGPFARTVVHDIYPVDGSALATYPILTDFYAPYAVAGLTGLEPGFVDPDIAVALVREGLAYVVDGAAVVGYAGSTDYYVGSADTLTLTIDDNTDDATIAGAYTSGTAEIRGAVAMWILNLKGGLSTMDRIRARAIESLRLVTCMIGMFTKAGGTFSWPASGGWLTDLSDTPSTFTAKQDPTTTLPLTQTAKGMGMSEAPRGGLAHFCTVTDGEIAAYQCVVPTTWNASPKDGQTSELSGPIEQAIIGAYFDGAQSKIDNSAGVTGTGTDAYAGVEALRIAQSFDPCIACAIH